MALYILITIAAVAAAYLIQKSQGDLALPSYGTRGRSLYRFSFAALFLILVIPAVLRQACGNDYLRYVEFFHLANVGAYVPTEPGFNVFVRLIYGLCGYENYILVFALFSIMTIGLFLVAIRQQAQYFAASFFVFMLCGYYFQTYNTVRYYFALALALYALRFFLERQYLPFVLVILFAATFHKSVLCVLVLYPLAAFAWRKWQAALLVLAGILLNVFRSQVMTLIVRLYPSYEDTEILAAGGHPSWANIARCTAVLLLCLICADHEKNQKAAAGTAAFKRYWFRKDRSANCLIADGKTSGVSNGVPSANDGEEAGQEKSFGQTKGLLLPRRRFYLHATALSLFIYVFCWFVPEVSRIAYYLVITQIFLVPEEIMQIPGDTERNRKRRCFLTILAGMACICIFAVFLRNAYRTTIKILPYKTFLFSDLPETPSRSIE